MPVIVGILSTSIEMLNKRHILNKHRHNFVVQFNDLIVNHQIDRQKEQVWSKTLNRLEYSI